MVQDIEHLRAELQLQRLVKRELAMDCKIPLGNAKSPQRIPRQVSLAGKRARDGESDRSQRAAKPNQFTIMATAPERNTSPDRVESSSFAPG
jgi:hypothetical protein